jgi:hypothetical protein
MHAAENREAVLRKEIAERNSVLPNEELYAVADGEFLEKLSDVESIDASLSSAATVASVTTAESQSLSTKTVNGDSSSAAGSTSGGSESAMARALERLTRPRAYPLFLAEKAAEFVEATVADLSKSLQGTSESPYYDPNGGSSNVPKERVVILGTGWGAASYLKAIDTDRYDVTVISPRNYFVFTPMLAGASVGTVEYRSITEPYVERAEAKSAPLRRGFGIFPLCLTLSRVFARSLFLSRHHQDSRDQPQGAVLGGHRQPGRSQGQNRHV